MKKIENGSSDIDCKTLKTAYKYAFDAAKNRMNMDEKSCTEGNSKCSLCSKRIQVILQIKNQEITNTVKVSGTPCVQT